MQNNGIAYYNIDDLFNITTETEEQPTSRIEVIDNQTKMLVQSLIQQSPQIIQDLRNNGKNLFYLEFKPETQKLLEQGYLQLSKAKDMDGYRAWLNGGKGIKEHGVLKNFKIKPMAPYQLALYAVTAVVKETQLEEINKSLNLINDKLDTLIRIELNKIKFETRSILNFLNDRLEPILVNGDLSNERVTYLNHLHFFEINIPLMLEELEKQSTRIENLPVPSFWGSKKYLDDCLKYMNEFVQLSANILTMFKTQILLLQVYNCFEKTNAVSYHNILIRVNENIKKFTSLYTTQRVKNTFKFIPLQTIELPSTKKYKEVAYQMTLDKMITPDDIIFETRRVYSVMESLQESEPVTLLDNTLQKQLEIKINDNNEIENVFVID